MDSPSKELVAHFRGISAINTPIGGRIFYRRAPQNIAKTDDYVIISGIKDLDYGHHTQGVTRLREGFFSICAFSRDNSDNIDTVMGLIVDNLTSLIGVQLGDWWISGFWVDGTDDLESDAPDADEDGIISTGVNFHVGFWHQPAE